MTEKELFVAAICIVGIIIMFVLAAWWDSKHLYKD